VRHVAASAAGAHHLARFARAGGAVGAAHWPGPSLPGPAGLPVPEPG
jgi:hypothetical protein